jgi:hypothetical protein
MWVGDMEMESSSLLNFYVTVLEMYYLPLLFYFHGKDHYWYCLLRLASEFSYRTIQPRLSRRKHIMTLQYVTSKTVLLVTSLEKYASIQTHVFQIGEQAKQVQYHYHLNPLSLTVLEILLWGFVKDNVYFLLLLASLDDQWASIKGTVAEIAPDKLHHTREEIHYWWGISRATSESHIKL